jgi:hypothetical protein
MSTPATSTPQFGGFGIANNSGFGSAFNPAGFDIKKDENKDKE